MGGTKIMVFQLKEIIRTAIFAIIGLILIIALIIFLIPKDNGAKSAVVYLPGTYSSQIVLHGQPVEVEVTVSESEITDIALKNMKETQEVFYPLFKPTMDSLSEQVIKYQTTKIATSSDAAITSQVLLDAIDAALVQANN